MHSKLLTMEKQIWNSIWLEMNKNRSNNWCKDKISWINWEKTYLDMRKRHLKAILYVMHSGDFGQLIMKDISTQKWKMSLSYSRKRLNKDLRIVKFQNRSPCLELEPIFIKNCIKNIMVTFKIQIKFTDKKTTHKSDNKTNKTLTQYQSKKVKGHRK